MRSWVATTLQSMIHAMWISRSTISSENSLRNIQWFHQRMKWPTTGNWVVFMLLLEVQSMYQQHSWKLVDTQDLMTCPRATGWDLHFDTKLMGFTFSLKLEKHLSKVLSYIYILFALEPLHMILLLLETHRWTYLQGRNRNVFADTGNRHTETG